MRKNKISSPLGIPKTDKFRKYHKAYPDTPKEIWQDVLDTIEESAIEPKISR